MSVVSYTLTNWYCNSKYKTNTISTHSKLKTFFWFFSPLLLPPFPITIEIEPAQLATCFCWLLAQPILQP